MGIVLSQAGRTLMFCFVAPVACLETTGKPTIFLIPLTLFVGLAMATYSELVAQMSQLQEQINQAREEEMATAFTQIRDIMETVRISESELLAHFSKRQRGNTGKVAPKYRSDNGDLWTGRGRKPGWVETALAQGRQLEDFAIPA